MQVQFHNGIIADEVMRHVEELAALGPRHSTSENERKAISYIEEKLGSTGRLKVHLQKTEPIVNWREIDSRLRVVEPIEQELTCRAILGCSSTPSKGVIAKLVYGGRGFPEDYESLDLAESIVIHDPPHARTLDNRCGEGQPQRDLRRVIQEGSKGLIEYARLPGRFIQAPLLAGREGLSLPAVSITYQDGLFLKELLQEWYAVPSGIPAQEKSPVRLWMMVKTETKMANSYNVIATKEGTTLPEEKILLVAHHDNAFGPGACDNASATAVLLEVAKAVSLLPSPKKTIEFVSVTGEEYGQAGSSDYVKGCGGSISNVKACVVLDLVGSGDKYYYITRSLYEGKVIEDSSWLNSVLEEVTHSLGFSIEPTILEFASDDGPFIKAGVPTSYICRCISKSWPWLHANEDTPDIIDPNALKVVGEICINTLLTLANSEERMGV